MEYNRRQILVLLLSFMLCFEKTFAAKKLIVLLVDGCRWDYIDDPKLKGFAKMIKNGVKAEYVVPIYPSLSYPNYQTIMTGLYAENHGFVDNYLYDSDTGKTFQMIPAPGSTDQMWWNDAEPLWITAQKNKKPAAMYWWAGCEVEIRGERPTICERQRYGPLDDEEKIDYFRRIDDVVHMFKSSKNHPDGRLSLALMYYGGVDYTGHHDGPGSSGVKKALREVDDILDYMQDKLEKAKLNNEVNIMVVADHGMTDISKAKQIDLNKFAEDIKLQISAATGSMIVPQNGMTDKLFNNIQNEKIEGLRVYKKENIPIDFHLKKSRRTTAILLQASKGYVINPIHDKSKMLGGGSADLLGHHGYDPAEVVDMRTIFIGTGPAFRKNYKSNPLNITDLYNVMCNILEIQPMPNNGSWENVKSMLMKENSLPYMVVAAASSHNHHSNVLMSIVTVLCVAFHLIKLKIIV